MTCYRVGTFVHFKWSCWEHTETAWACSCMFCYTMQTIKHLFSTEYQKMMAGLVVTDWPVVER